MSTADGTPEGEEAARGVAQEIFELLALSSGVYDDAYRNIEGAGKLDTTTRESVIRTVASVATALRRLAPSLSMTASLPETERPELALVVLRLLSDSLCIALSEQPDLSLMVNPNDIEAFARGDAG